jgi:hypothetical protein
MEFIEAVIYMIIVIIILVIISAASFVLGSFVADTFHMEGIVWWAFVILFILFVCKVLN